MASRLTAQRKVERDAAVVRDRARGLTWATIAERHTLSERQCRTVWRERATDASHLLEVPPLESFRDAYDQLESLMEDAVLLEEATKNDSVRVAALKLRQALLSDKIALLRECGLLPYNLRSFRDEAQVNELVDMIIDALHKHDVGQEVLDSLDAALEAAVSRNGHAAAA